LVLVVLIFGIVVGIEPKSPYISKSSSESVSFNFKRICKCFYLQSGIRKHKWFVFLTLKLKISVKTIARYALFSLIIWLAVRHKSHNHDALAQRLEDTANRLLAVERTVVNGVPKAVEEAMENLKS
jgi:hypothetical protein